jgi:transposase
MTYSIDLRKKALNYLKKGNSWQLASETFGVTTRTLANWLRREKEQNLAPKPRKCNPSKIDSEKLRDYISLHPDAYLKEIAKEFCATASAVFYACKRLKITLKKRSHFTKNEMRKSAKHLTKS